MRLTLTVVTSLALLALLGGVERLGAIEGREATYEWTADAPWRMEPTMTPCSGGTCQT